MRNMHEKDKNRTVPDIFNNQEVSDHPKVNKLTASLCSSVPLFLPSRYSSFIENKKLISVVFILIITILHSYTTVHAEKHFLNENESKTAVLLSRDVTLEPPVWCGNNSFAVSSEHRGMRLINILTKEELKIHSSGYVGATSCTSDGNWLIYVDTRTSRWDRGSYEKGIVDFWRYNLKSGKHNKFAIASGGGEFSPNGKRILFFNTKPKSTVEQSGPIWNLIWMTKDWPTGHGLETKWLNDSSNIIIINDNKFYIEKINKNASVRQLDANLDHVRISNLKIDNYNRIYLLAESKREKDRKITYKKKRLLKCQIMGDKLQCDDFLMRDRSIARYDLTPDGENIVFIDEGKTWKKNSCIWHVKRGSETKCITPLANVNSSLSISPDGRWVTFTRYREIKNGIHTDDLYVVDLYNK